MEGFQLVTEAKVLGITVHQGTEPPTVDWDSKLNSMATTAKVIKANRLSSFGKFLPSEGIKEIVGTLDDVADWVFLEKKQAAKFGRTISRPVTLAQPSANSYFTFSSKGKSRLTGTTGPQDTLRESDRVVDVRLLLMPQ